MARTSTFALVSDVHFGPEARFAGKLRKLTARAPELLGAFVRRMNELVRPDFVVNLGDDLEDESPEADRARYAEFLGVLRGLDAPRVHVAGNHDTIHLKLAELATLWGPDHAWLGAAWRGPDDAGLHYAFDRDGVHFVVLHSHEKKDVEITLGSRQLAWLERQLARTALPTVVLVHHGVADQDLTGNRWFEGLEHICLVKERGELRRILAASGKVLVVVNGHLHWNHFDVVDELPIVTLQSLIENLDDDAPGRPAAAHAVVRVAPRGEGRFRVAVSVEGAERAHYQLDRTLRLG